MVCEADDNSTLLSEITIDNSSPFQMPGVIIFELITNGGASGVHWNFQTFISYPTASYDFSAVEVW